MSPVRVASQKFVCFLPLLALFAEAQQQGKFLGGRPDVVVAEKRGPADRLAELESQEHVVDFDHVKMTAMRTERLEVALLPLFRIAPKDASGAVDADAARYLLHRLFASRHGWFVNGLELHQGIVNTSNVGRALYDSGSSFSLHELARFAASVETLVHAENIKRLQKVFNMFGFSRERPYEAAEAGEMIENYMIFFLTIAMPEPRYTYNDKRFFCVNTLPEWNDTLLFAGEVERNVIDAREETETPTLWEHTLRVVEEIGERYGRWQNKGCLRLKSQLMELEIPGTGRVSLSSFWGGLVDGTPKWPFRESITHLEQLGALDGEGSRQSVVIPNYLYGASNCLAGSKYYDVCCLNECESLLGEIEAQVSAPTAPPARLAEIVAKLPSSTVSAPGLLPTALSKRLDDIADQHDGVVPLHGRLFWQFLSHAYPRECPYPRLSISKSVDTETWMKRMDDGAEVNFAHAQEYVNAKRALKDEDIDSVTQLPWTNEEELFMHSISVDVVDGSGMSSEASMLMSFAALSLAVCALAFRLRHFLPKRSGLQSTAPSKCYYV